MKKALIATTSLLAALLAPPAFADDDDLPKMRAIAEAMKLISLEEATAKRSPPSRAR